NVDVVLEVGMEIEQDEQTIAGGVFDVVENVLRFEDGLRGLIAGIERLESFGDSPAVSLELKLPANGAHHLDDLRLLVALDRNQRCARTNDGRQIAERT